MSAQSGNSATSCHRPPSSGFPRGAGSGLASCVSVSAHPGVCPGSRVPWNAALPGTPGVWAGRGLPALHGPAVPADSENACRTQGSRAFLGGASRQRQTNKRVAASARLQGRLLLHGLLVGPAARPGRQAWGRATQGTEGTRLAAASAPLSLPLTSDPTGPGRPRGPPTLPSVSKVLSQGTDKATLTAF